MRSVIGAILAVLLFTTVAGAQEQAAPSDADRAAIRGVIGGQIEAFKRDDAAGAFGFAAPHIQAMFGDAEHFMVMVRRTYQPVYRPRSVQFGALTTLHGDLVQLVDLIGPDGAPALALYTMERQADGSWRIGGCSLADRPGESA